MKNNESVKIIEIFSSIQGEGPYLGKRQIFLRLCGCNLNCNYCDTNKSMVDNTFCRVEQHPGKGDFVYFENPIFLQDIIKYIKNLNCKKHHSLSITGGEPLISVSFLEKFLPVISKDIGIFLETNGTLPENLKKVIKYIDIISCDIKLPSVCGEVVNLEFHKEFLQTAREKELIIKIPVSKDTEICELKKAFSLIKETAPGAPVILQPLTQKEKKPYSEQLLLFQEIGLKYLKDVRVIPQTHAFMGVM